MFKLLFNQKNFFKAASPTLTNPLKIFPNRSITKKTIMLEIVVNKISGAYSK